MARKYSNQKKASDQELIDAYKKIGNIWKVAAQFDMCGQSVHQRLKKIGIPLNYPKFSEPEIYMLKEDYAFYASKGDLDSLAAKMGRTKQFLCRQAKRLGLTNRKRKKPYSSEPSSIRMKKWMKNHKHPRGMLGKHHTTEVRQDMAIRSKKMWEEMSQEKRDGYSKRFSMIGRKSFTNREGATWKCGWREIGGIRKYYRSRWEANYARYLEWLKQRGEILKWEHEPETFWFEGIKRGCMSYLPDFRVTEKDGSIAFHEVKGWMDDRSKTKINRMRIYHPKVKLVVIEKEGYKSIKNSVGRMIEGWEE